MPVQGHLTDSGGHGRLTCDPKLVTSPQSPVVLNTQMHTTITTTTSEGGWVGNLLILEAIGI